MSFYPPEGGGGGGGGMPAPFSQKVIAGKLQTLQDTTVIAEQDQYGSWVKTGLATGTGSIHLGDIHSMGSAGENVVFVNNNSSFAYYPAWGGVSLDGQSSFDVSARRHGPLLNAEPVGAADPMHVGDYDVTFTVTSSVAFFKLIIFVAENYVGKLRWVCEVITGTTKEVAEFYSDVSLTSGQSTIIQFKYPLWAKNGQTFHTKLTKEDGSVLQVYYGTTTTTKPYRQTFYRAFNDYDVLDTGNPDKAARALETLTGAARVDASAIKNLDAGGYVGTINFAGNLTQFDNASKQNYWKAATAGTLGGATFAVGDQLVCKQTVVGTPANLTDATYWTINPNTNAIATPTLAGMIKPVDGLAVVADGSTSVKVGYGLKFDASKNVVVDPPNIDVTTFQKADLLVSGIYKGGLDGSSTLTTLANAVKGNWWNVSAAVTISGTAFAVGDQLWCSTTVVGAPANLTSFVRVPSTSAQATATAFGTVKMGSATPLVDGTASVGSSLAMAREDHVHPVSPSVTTSVNGLMLATDKVKLDAFSPLASTLPLVDAATAAAGTSAVPARVDHVHPVRYDKCGIDFTVSTTPLRVFRDYMWCSAQSGASVTGDNVPWLVSSQADADILAAYWLQQITTFFKNLENDTQWDQLIGGIPAASSISSKLASGTFAVTPNAGTDMDNYVGVAAATPTPPNYATEWFELVVASKAGSNPEYYTMWFNLGSWSSAISTPPDATILYPFRIVFQTTANQTLATFPVTAVNGGISGTAPKTTARTGSWTPVASAFLICAEPLTIECKR